MLSINTYRVNSSSNDDIYLTNTNKQVKSIKCDTGVRFLKRMRVVEALNMST